MSKIKGPAAAAAVLDALLPSIQASLDAVRSGSRDARVAAVLAAQKRLRDFANSTVAAHLDDSAEIEAVDEIDNVARAVHSKLTADAIGASVDNIVATAAELKALSEQLGQVAAVNEGAAKSIALDPIKKAVDSMTAIVGSVKSLKANLSAADPDEAKVIIEIEKLVDQFETLRQAVTAGA